MPEEQIPDLRDQKDRLANLQLLQGAINNEKNAKMPGEWLSSEFDHEKRREYRQLHLLGKVPSSITEFDDFYNERRAELKQEIVRLLGR